MGELKLYGMRSAYDERLATALKRKHEPQRLVGDLLKAKAGALHQILARHRQIAAREGCRSLAIKGIRTRIVTTVDLVNLLEAEFR